jgi:hypothetical protein
LSWFALAPQELEKLRFAFALLCFALCFFDMICFFLRTWTRLSFFGNSPGYFQSLLLEFESLMRCAYTIVASADDHFAGRSVDPIATGFLVKFFLFVISPPSSHVSFPPFPPCFPRVSSFPCRARASGAGADLIIAAFARGLVCSKKAGFFEGFCWVHSKQ